MSSNELKKIPIEPIIDILWRLSTQRFGILLFPDVNNNRISGLEGSIVNSIYESCEEAMFKNETCKLVTYRAQGE